MKKDSPTMHKVLGIIRILLGAGMFGYGIMKLLNAGNADMVQMVGSAGHAMGLTFISVTIWYWIATIGEIIAGACLLTGHKYKIGAILTIVIMIFALRAIGPAVQPIIFLVAAALILWKGPGKWMICPCKECKHACCGGDHAPMGHPMQQQ